MKFLITDFETTGLDPKVSEIIEIGSVLCDAETLEIEKEFEIRMKPSYYAVIDPKAVEINGYTPEEWVDAATQMAGFRTWTEWHDKTMIFTGTNVVFDWQFYVKYLNLYSLPDKLDYHRFDVTSMCVPFLPHPVNSYSMKAISPALGVKTEPEVHRALAGAKNGYRNLKKAFELGRYERQNNFLRKAVENV